MTTEANAPPPGKSVAGTPTFPTQTFRRRIKIGFALVVILAATITVSSLFALRSVIAAKDQVISEYAHDVTVARELELASEQNASSSRAFLLTGDPQYLEKTRGARERFKARVEELRSTTPLPEEARLLQEVAAAAQAHHAALDHTISAERLHGDPRGIAELFEATVRPKREELKLAVGRLVHEKERLLREAVTRSQIGAGDTMAFVASLGSVAAVLATVLFFLSTRTLTSLAEAEAEICNLNEHLEQRVQERTREIEGFAYTVAHDLRAPLRAMAGFSDILLEESGSRLDQRGQDSLRRIKKAASRMDDLIHGILSLARLSYESFTLVQIDVSEVVREVVSSKQDDILAGGATVDIHADPIRAAAHPSLLALSLDHLLENALKFTSPDVPPHIDIQVQGHGNSVRVSVRDNGIGIPPEYHHRIFGVFERLHPSEGFPGIGIGLALVRRAVGRMGGTVGVQANPDGGATFWIELNLATGADERPYLLPSRSPGLSGAH
jgi:signal transduction histidine kinase